MKLKKVNKRKLKKVKKSVNVIYNEDCRTTMRDRIDYNSVDLVITSPPYNNSRVIKNQRAMNNHESRYKDYNDNMTDEEYKDFILDVFEGYDLILKENGVVLFNLSYGSKNPGLIYQVITAIIEYTSFMVADTIVWKKKSALPNNTSCNKLTRVCEFVFVFCRKKEYDTFTANKKVTKVSKVGQKFYSPIYNFFESPNNDGSNDLNKATFSTQFVKELLDRYVPEGSKDFIVYDSFNGTGTTSVACKEYGVNYIGSELSKEQCDYAKERLDEVL